MPASTDQDEIVGFRTDVMTLRWYRDQDGSVWLWIKGEAYQLEEES
jgi:hypothetical protein